MDGRTILDEIDFGVGHGTRVPLQMHVDEAEGRLTDITAVIVSADADDGVNVVTRSVKAVEPFELGDDALIGVHRKNAILIAVDEQQGTRRNESGDPRPGPLERVI